MSNKDVRWHCMTTRTARCDGIGNQVEPRGGGPLSIGCIALVGLLAVIDISLPSIAGAQPSDTSSTPARLVAAFDNMFGGQHPGLRAVHSRGIVLEGRFFPAPSAANLSRATHMTGGAVPIVVRFSNFP